MMLSWILYALVVGTLLAAMAAAVDGGLRVAGRPTRWVWGVALGLTVTLMLLAPARFAQRAGAPTQVRLPVSTAVGVRHVPAGLELLSLTLREIRDAIVAPVQHALGAARRPTPTWMQRMLAAIWGALAIALVVVFGSVHRRFARARRDWPRTELLGTPVRVAPEVGPAVVGLTRPEIVVPRWLLARTPEEQVLVLAHEREHVKAHDPQLLALGCLAVTLLPWHPAAWWMLSRLRLAVELDCDARVLRGGVAPRSYGTLLIDLAGQCSGFRVGAPALADESSHLERRLLAMKTKVPRYAPARAALLAVAGAAALLAACEAKLPTATEVADMKVADAEQGARKISLIAANDSAAQYTVDGRTVTSAEAHAIPADQIASIEVEKRAGSGGDVSRIAIRTRKAGDPGGPHDMMFRVKSDSMTATTAGGKMEVRKFGGIVLVDGVRVSESAMQNIPPADIVSVEVVKGPAATKLYDAPEAVNGVIRITTKKGAANKQ